MPLLDAEPPAAPKTLEELFTLAHAMESEAAERYAAFARTMAGQGRAELAAVFAAVAEEERGHVAGVDAWSRARVGHAPDAGALHAPALPTFDPESEAEIAGSALMTPYRALSIAVRNEERAFAFWTYLAAHATREDVRGAAERMASEELTHAATFRRERRRAYHRAREAGADVIDAAEGERRLARLLAGEAGGSARPPWPPSAEDLSEALSRIPGGGALSLRAPVAATADQLAEELADAYVGAAGAAEDAAEAWQDLAERAIRRMAFLRSHDGSSGRPAG